MTTPKPVCALTHSAAPRTGRPPIQACITQGKMKPASALSNGGGGGCGENMTHTDAPGGRESQETGRGCPEGSAPEGRSRPGASAGAGPLPGVCLAAGLNPRTSERRPSRCQGRQVPTSRPLVPSRLSPGPNETGAKDTLQRTTATVDHTWRPCAQGACCRVQPPSGTLQSAGHKLQARAQSAWLVDRARCPCSFALPPSPRRRRTSAAPWRWAS